MPICTAVIAAALLSGPAALPVDPMPKSGNDAAVSSGKQFAKEAMKHPDDPDFIMGKAMDLLKAKGPKMGQGPQGAGTTSEGNATPQGNAMQQDDSAPRGDTTSRGDTEDDSAPQDVSLKGDNATTGPQGSVLPQGMTFKKPNVTGQQSSDEAADAWAYPPARPHKHKKTTSHRAHHAKPYDDWQ
ncbi:hypothetical protein N5079_15935 [Planotetraspora sp. A-T 1434]|uniref:hypothetical protein n=1 Tax=Planotetraspora sp. A-T 1434 TaxID=2979219 RepID=UPI0021BFBDCC|nr:hypothetical protein [Planotetraspora sp. A-T 1434]MCT9931703.1 hypothetical protein [Planotetraspora sp. A-T 1434]